MIKAGKITVKHYLNTRLKPEIEKDKTVIYPLYISITYDRMNVRTPSNIYNGISTIITEDNFLKNKIDKPDLFKMNYESDLIKRSVEKFQKDENSKHLQQDYHLLYPLKKYRSKNERLNIFNSYIDFLTHSIYDVVSDFLHNKIKNAVTEKINSDFKHLDLLDSNKIKLLFYPNNPKLYDLIIKYELGEDYELYYILYSRFHSYLAQQGNIYGYDMPYLDWKQGKGQIIFKEFLRTYSLKTDCWKLDFFTDKQIEKIIDIIEKIINNENYLKKLLEKNS